MEHLGIGIECKSFLEGNGWQIELVITGVGGEREAGIVSKWLHDIIVQNSDCLELPRGQMQ